jgi:PBP1b-binding outer membrane lipoprotein LpoB
MTKAVFSVILCLFLFAGCTQILTPVDISKEANEKVAEVNVITLVTAINAYNILNSDDQITETDSFEQVKEKLKAASTYPDYMNDSEGAEALKSIEFKDGTAAAKE